MVFLEWVQRQDFVRLVLEGRDIPAALVIKAQEGDSNALSELSLIIRNLALKYLRGHRMPESDAEDLANDAVIAIIRRLQSEKEFDDLNKVDRFTMGVIKNLRREFYRKKVKYSPSVLGGDTNPLSARDQSYLQQYMGIDHDPEGLYKIIDDEDRERLKDALEQLRKLKPEWYKVIMHYLDDPAYKSIQQAMNFTSINQVKQKIHSAKVKLKELLGIGTSQSESISDEYLDFLLESLIA